VEGEAEAAVSIMATTAEMATIRLALPVRASSCAEAAPGPPHAGWHKRVCFQDFGAEYFFGEWFKCVLANDEMKRACH
jgi:hypothetical protein